MTVTILFEAGYRGDPVIITHATQDEIGFLAGTVDSAGDLLELWSFIAVRFGPAVEVHALGWRLFFANAWIEAAAGNDSQPVRRTRRFFDASDPVH